MIDILLKFLRFFLRFLFSRSSATEYTRGGCIDFNRSNHHFLSDLNKNIYKKNQIEKPLERERELHNEKKVDAIADRVR
jgi:hypothetical protein